MPTLRLATFNVENLLMRCDFSKAGIASPRRALTAVSDQTTADKVSSVFDVLSEDDRTLTAQALAATRADVCAVQEVENLVTLSTFNQTYLRRWCPQPFQTVVLKEGNDGRGIDVGLLSNLEVRNVVSHAGLQFKDLGQKPSPGASQSDRVFRRDCLEVDVIKDGQPLTLFIVHFKSMHGGRIETKPVRYAEAAAVRTLIERRFPDPGSADWAVLGDFNDYFEIDGADVDDHAMEPLIGGGFGHDIAALTIGDVKERWSHHYAPLKQYSALDHIVVSPKLADLNRAANSKFVRVGVPWRSERHNGFRLPGVGWSNPKASDHCPLVVNLAFGAA